VARIAIWKPPLQRTFADLYYRLNVFPIQVPPLANGKTTFCSAGYLSIDLPKMAKHLKRSISKRSKLLVLSPAGQHSRTARCCYTVPTANHQFLYLGDLRDRSRAVVSSLASITKKRELVAIAKIPVPAGPISPPGQRSRLRSDSLASPSLTAFMICSPIEAPVVGVSP